MPATRQQTLREILAPVLDAVAEPRLRVALLSAVDAESDALSAIDQFFTRFSAARRSTDFLACFFNSWRATHLKMLAIYGLSCRLQRLAADAEPDDALTLFKAAALNAATSYEDLGLDYDAVTHATLYEEFAACFLPDDQWMQQHHGLPAARVFGQWVYRNMVVEPIPIGLLTNLFSEVYNHAEYTLAYRAFSRAIDLHHHFDPTTRRRALTYIGAHLEDATELEHFDRVLRALDHYARVTGSAPSSDQAVAVFRSYLRQLGTVMGQLQARMDNVTTA